MWYKTDWDASKLHPICSGNIWVNPSTGKINYFNTATGKWTIASTLPTLTLSGGVSTTLACSPRLWNSGFYFNDSTYYLAGGVISKYLGGGTGSSDQYWTGSNFIGTFTKQGAASADVTSAWAADFGQLECSTQAGEYTGSGGTAYMGMRDLSCGSMGTLSESMTYANGKPTFKAVADGLGTWLIKWSGSYWTLSLGGNIAGTAVPWWKGGVALEGSYEQQWSGDDATYVALASVFKQGSVAVAIASWQLTTGKVACRLCEVSHFLNGSR